MYLNTINDINLANNQEPSSIYCNSELVDTKDCPNTNPYDERIFNVQFGEWGRVGPKNRSSYTVVLINKSSMQINADVVIDDDPKLGSPRLVISKEGEPDFNILLFPDNQTIEIDDSFFTTHKFIRKFE